MKSEELKIAIRRYYDEAFSGDDYRIIDELFSKDILLQDPSMPPVHGREALKEQLRLYRQVFSDGRNPVEDIIVEGSKVVVRGYHEGTHSGDMMGISATGKHFRVPFVDIWEVSNDRVIRGWTLTDNLGFLRQVGLTHLPEMEPERMAA